MSQKIKTSVEIDGSLSASQIPNATVDTDKFLVSDGGVVKHRTGAQVLSDLGITLDTATKLQHQVKAGVAINKGQAVYVTDADGTNMIVGLASNGAEATSSKTMGLIDATVSINGFANVVTEGLLDGLNTLGATIGNPVWLGTNGNLIYGLANKPSAPSHLVFIGIVTRVNANNGEIFVKVQNGFELDELHDVDLKSTAPSGNDILAYEGAPSNVWKPKSISTILGYTPASSSKTISTTAPLQGGGDLSANRTLSITQASSSTNGYLSSTDWNTFNNKQNALTNPITGTGTTNYLPKFTGSGTLGNSLIYDNGTNIGIGTTSPSNKLVVDGGSSDYIPIWAKSSLLASSKYYSSLLAGYGLTSNQSAQFGYVYDTVTPTNSYAHITPFGSAEGSKFMVRADGNVGIGTTSPSYKLTVRNDVAASTSLDQASIGLYNNSDGGSSIYFSNAVGGQSKLSFGVESTGVGSDDTYLGFSTGANTSMSERMRITSGGNVGIGTTSPSSLLQINPTNFSIAGRTASVYGTADSDTIFTVGRSGIDYPILLNIGINQTSQYGVISVNQFTAGGKPLIIQPSGGNVGIGTTSPSEKLDVNGVIRGLMPNDPLSGAITAKFLSFSANPYGLIFRGYSTGAHSIQSQRESSDSTLFPLSLQPLGGNVGIGTTSPTYKLDISTDSSSGFRITSPTSDTYIVPDFYGSGVSSILTGAGSKHLAFGISSSEKMRITTDGNVGIGTTSPIAITNYTSTTINGTNGGILQIQQGGNNSLRLIGEGTDAYIDNLATGALLFRTTSSSTERMRITSSGNVGIGTTAPNRLLTVSGTQSVMSFNATSYRNTTIGSDSVGSFIVYDDTASAYRMVINSSGNVGIGTTSPDGALTVAKSAPSSYVISSIRNLNSGIGGAVQGTQLNFYGDVGYPVNAPTSFIQSTSNDGGSSGQGSLRFGNHNGSTSVEQMRITSGGNVGIGTTSPFRTLDVNGTLRLQTPTIDLGNSTDNQIWVSSNNINFKTNGSEKAIITSSGNVGIGTTSPLYKLDVSGDIAMSYGSSIRARNYTYSKLIEATWNGSYDIVNIYTAGDGAVNSSPKITILNNGNVGIGVTSPATKLDVAGAVTASGGFFNSDIRLKDIIDYEYSVSDIKPITYLWKDGRDDKKHVGYSAQEVQKVMPDAVNESSDGMLSVNYVEILVAKISQMEKEIAYLKSKI